MYSRPSTSTVDALTRVSLPNAPDIIGNPQVTQSANGRFLDFRSPQQLQRNGEARAAEITNFVEGLTKVAKPLIDDALLKQAKNQVGELLATQDPVQLIRSGTEEQRALVRSLSPQAQDLLNDKAAQGAVRLYQETYSAERTKRAAVLQSLTASPEEKAKAESEAKSLAMEASGISKLPPSYIATYGDQLVQTDAALRGLDYKETLKNQTKEQRAQLGNSYRATFGQLTDLHTQAAGKGNAKAAEEFVIMLRNGWSNQIKRDSGAFTPLEQAEVFTEAVQTEIARLTAQGDWRRADQMIGTLQVMADAGVTTGTDANLNFFDQRLSNGYTPRYIITSMSESVQKGLKNWQNEQAFESVRDLMPRALQGEDVMPELISRMGSMTPEQIMQIAPALAQLEGVGDRPSDAQLLRAGELEVQLQGMSRDAALNLLRGEVNAGRIKVHQFGQLTGRIGKDDPRLALIDSQRSSLSGELTQAALDVAQAMGADKERATNYIREFSNDVVKATEKRLAEMEAQGKPVDETVVRSVMRNEIEAARSRRIKDDKERERLRSQSGPRSTVLNEVQEFQRNVEANNGNVTVMSFSKPMRVDFQQKFPNRPMTVDNLLRFQAERMKGVPADKDGKPAFEDPNRMLKDIIKRSKGEATSSSSPAERLSSGLMTYIDKGPLGALLRQLQKPEQAGAAEMPSPTTPSQGQAKPASKPQPKPQAQPEQNVGARIIGAGLEMVAGVITPPAAAATRTSQPQATVAVENQAAVDTLMRLWRGQQRVQMSTPPLPQLSAQTPVQMVGTAITNAMHPIFVAIGIAEGTRTAAGGYTRAYYGHRDPGSGAWNKGTVSGQNAPNAEQVDRQWMARLSAASARIAPVLQRLGFAPGTQGYNRLMFNVLDLMVQAPLAAQDFIKKLPKVAQAGASIEAIAKARADSFINPATGRLDASGFDNSYSRLLADQRSRAGAFDYKRRI